MKLSKLKGNPKAEQEGVWEEYEGNFKVKVARLGNPLYEAHLQRLMKPHLRKFRGGSIPLELAASMTQKATARHILLGWEGLLDDDGKPIPHSVEKATEILTNPDYRQFFRDILEMAGTQEIFEREDEAETEGNSQGA